METPQQQLQRLLKTPEAAAYLGIAAATLETWRCRGGGPKYRKVGKRAVRYAPADLDAWLAERTRESTSDDTALQRTVIPLRGTRRG